MKIPKKDTFKKKDVVNFDVRADEFIIRTHELFLIK